MGCCSPRSSLTRTPLSADAEIARSSQTLAEHQEHLRTVLGVLEHHQLYANQKKCYFGCESVEYLGHVISGEGVSADLEKISAMEKWPVPRNVKALRGFLGLTGYYKKFVQGYGEIARPLTALLKKDRFSWGSEAEEAFLKLKRAMVTVPVLAMADFTSLFVVESDASGVGLRAVLMYNQRPVAYFSQALTETNIEVNLRARADGHRVCHPEMEALSLGKKGWKTKLQTLCHEKEVMPQLFALSVPAAIQLEDICSEVNRDSQLKKLKEEVLRDPSTHPDFSVVQGRLFRQGKLVLPRTSQLVGVILREFHDGKVGGHEGVLKTQRRIGDLFYWQGMMTEIREYVAECLVCQKHKYSTLVPAGLLQPLPVPEQIWEDISMDFIEGLPKSEGYDVIMVVVDMLTKSAHFSRLKHPFVASEVALLFIQEVVRLHGFPKTLVSDRDKHILKAQQAMKRQADKHRREVEFQVGDMVYLKLKPYRQKSLARRSNEKLSARYYSPYEVLARVGEVAYKLKLLAEAKVHHTYHVSQLKLAKGSLLTPADLPPQLIDEGYLAGEPEFFMGFRNNILSGQPEVPIKWKGLAACDSTWEWTRVIQEQFPAFHLEDKVNIQTPGNDTSEREKQPIIFQYCRKAKKPAKETKGPVDLKFLEAEKEHVMIEEVRVVEEDKSSE
ncbi:hypothetical protein AALP_AA3G368400 [Arabis alpina]|uniref:Integrase catalytic domain-containing protein n=1 Tax=Arabis alpina TaxID=50452 RepID=A0A087HE47_ARAAL|nr:hypothetical protein AALP_AA3G368400 [Arabis alpina]